MTFSLMYLEFICKDRLLEYRLYSFLYDYTIFYSLFAHLLNRITFPIHSLNFPEFEIFVNCATYDLSHLAISLDHYDISTHTFNCLN